MDLTLQQLRNVLAVAHAGSFTAAGEQLRVAQSSLSRSIAEVEHRVGTALFQRTTRRVVLTPEGEEFVRMATRVLDCFDTGMNHFTGFLRGQTGQVKIATLPSLAATVLPSIVAAYRREHPGVSITIEDALLGEVVAQVTSGKVDFALTVVTEPLEGLTFRKVASDEFCCVFPRSHRFSTYERLRWTDLDGEPFIQFDRTSSVRTHCERALTEAGVKRGSVTEARNVAAVAGLVAAGLGVSAVPSLVLPLLKFADLAHLPLVEPRVARPVGIAIHPERRLAPTAQGFLHAIMRAARSGTHLPAGATWA